MLKVTKPVLVLALLFGWSLDALAAPASTKEWLLDLTKGTSTVEFRATGRPSALKIVGKGGGIGGGFKITPAGVSGETQFDLSTLDTGMALRNRHMKEKYLETEKFPTAKLTITKLVLPATLGEGAIKVEKLPFEGKLSLHGVEKPVSGVTRIEGNAERLSFTADFSLKISDFQIATPGFAGITMAENVDVSVQAEAPLAKKQ